MTTLTIFLILLFVAGVYVFANERGKRKKAEQLSEQAQKSDQREVQDELDEKRSNDAWDNLNDTLDDIGK